MSDFDCDPLFSRLYLEMLEQMTAYSARRLGDIGLAEDVAQDTFAECWKNWEQGQRVKHHPNPRGWLWEALKIKLKKMCGRTWRRSARCRWTSWPTRLRHLWSGGCI